MKRDILISVELCAAIVFAAPSTRAETLDPVDFARTVSFTASGYDGESTLENFPALVRLSEGIEGFLYADVGGTTNAVYKSLRFTDADNGNLDYEIEEWNPSGVSFVWVSLPSLSGTNTQFKAFYAPVAGATLPAVHPTNVWTSAGYVGVWHLSDIVKNYAAGYKAYADHLWGHVFPDSTGRGANATKGTTSWNTSLMNVPNDANGYHFPESLGRANGTLGANGYTPFVIPPPSEGGGTADWTFSGTGYSTEAWVFPFANQHNVFVSGQAAGGNSDNFLYLGTNDVRMASRSWGNRSVGWNPERIGEEKVWHFVTAVWTPAASAEPSVLYGTSAGGAPHVLMERTDYRATDQFAADGMTFTSQTGIEFGLDEMRVRRGLSTPDWIQANWDAQRDGTDFLEYGAVGDPRAPIVSAIARTSARAAVAFSLAVHGSGAVKALFVAYPSFETNAVSVSNPARPSVRATGLSPDTDYTVRFVVESGGAVVYETPETAFVTAGRPTIGPHDYRRSVTFTATGYDGAETLEHFPVLVHLSEATVPGFDYTGVDPAQLRFATTDGSLLAHEVETWDPSGLSTIWVCLPSLAGTNTAFTMHLRPYNGDGVPAQPVHRVWHYAGYLAVWHMNDTVQGVYGRQFDDSSGHGMVTTNYFASNNLRPPLVVTNAAESANGTAWFRNRNAYWGDAQADYLKYGVTPEQTADWNFSATGYSVETWARPAWLHENDHGTMFCTSLRPEAEGGGWNALNALCVRNDRVALESDWKTHNANHAWTGDATNDWHYVVGVWAAAGSGEASIAYEARADLPGQIRTVLSRTDVVACDFVGRHMGLVGGNPPPRASGYQSYQVDEMRVRRGRSSADWVQANWDTQRLGTDFLSAGPVVDHLLPTVLLLR